MTTVSFEICLVIALYRIDVNQSIRPRCFFHTFVKKNRRLASYKATQSNIYFIFRLVYFIHYNVTVFTHFNLVHFILALSTFGQLPEVSLCLGGTLRGVLLLLPRVDRTDNSKKQD